MISAEGAFFFDNRLLTHVYIIYVFMMIPDCCGLIALAILKTFVIRSLFFENRLLTHVLAAPKFRNSPISKLASNF